jgi:hypothetical protein
MALLYVTSTKWLGVFLAVDLAAFLLWKVLRNDFRHWVRWDPQPAALQHSAACWNTAQHVATARRFATQRVAAQGGMLQHSVMLCCARARIHAHAHKHTRAHTLTHTPAHARSCHLQRQWCRAGFACPRSH